MADLRAQNEQMQAAQAEIASAKSDSDRVAAQQKVAALQEKQKTTQTNIAAVQRGRERLHRFGFALP